MLSSLNTCDRSHGDSGSKPSPPPTLPIAHRRPGSSHCAEPHPPLRLPRCPPTASLLSHRRTSATRQIRDLVRQFQPWHFRHPGSPIRRRSTPTRRPDPPTPSPPTLASNQITPFLRSPPHRQTKPLLEAMRLDAAGVHSSTRTPPTASQWPPAPPSIADRPDPNNPPSIRITGAGTDINPSSAAAGGPPPRPSRSSLGPLPLPPPSTRFERQHLQLHSTLKAKPLAVNCVNVLEQIDEGRHPLERGNGSRGPGLSSEPCKSMVSGVTVSREATLRT
ncbi:uncharacterized protein A4U43_C05F11240 [Asparagus officinalis]|uniref:Uncharacterized protein n=1 Tax=Asparagus officinalis TaxID=4686 RepID=A0A5P1EQX1_ASPOF|nr:uncharacterized protein A4U43_C05F11240 [Asparagus officinalis]